MRRTRSGVPVNHGDARSNDGGAVAGRVDHDEVYRRDQSQTGDRAASPLRLEQSGASRRLPRPKVSTGRRNPDSRSLEVRKSREQLLDVLRSQVEVLFVGQAGPGCVVLSHQNLHDAACESNLVEVEGCCPPCAGRRRRSASSGPGVASPSLDGGPLADVLARRFRPAQDMLGLVGDGAKAKPG